MSTSTDEWDADPDAAATAIEAEPEEFQPRYASTELWVRGWLGPLYRRESTGTHGGEQVQWCAEWWNHPEADDRLTALWWSWEGARRDKNPAAMANWWLLVMDPMWRALTGQDGPFTKCTRGHVDQLPELEVKPAPEGWWDGQPPHPGDPGPSTGDTAASGASGGAG